MRDLDKLPQASIHSRREFENEPADNIHRKIQVAYHLKY